MRRYDAGGERSMSRGREDRGYESGEKARGEKR